MRLVPTIIACVLSALAGAAATFIWTMIADSDPHRPTLLSNLPKGSWETQNSAFDRRVLQIVPLGSPESELLTLLKSQGFSREWDAVGSREQKALYDDRNHASFVICGALMQVWWTVDQQDRIVGFRSFYSDDGCP